MSEPQQRPEGEVDSGVAQQLDSALTASEIQNHTGAREYLESAVVPVVLQGLTALTRVRPENPVDYFALYLLKRNGAKSYTVEVKNPPGPAAPGAPSGSPTA